MNSLNENDQMSVYKITAPLYHVWMGSIPSCPGISGFYVNAVITHSMPAWISILWPALYTETSWKHIICLLPEQESYDEAWLRHVDLILG